MWSTSKDWKTGYVIKTGPTETFFSNKRSTLISDPQLKTKKLWDNAGSLEKLETYFGGRSTIKYDIIYYGVTMDLWKKYFIVLAESFPRQWGLLPSATTGGMTDG